MADTWGMHGDVGWGWMVLMMAVMVLLWGAVIFGIVWLIRSVAGGGRGPSKKTRVSRETAVQLLERRFAEDALTLEDYRTRREVLVNGTAEPDGAPSVGVAGLRSSGATALRIKLGPPDGRSADADRPSASLEGQRTRSAAN